MTKLDTPLSRQEMQNEAIAIEALLDSAMALNCVDDKSGLLSSVEAAHQRAKLLQHALDTVNDPQTQAVPKAPGANASKVSEAETTEAPKPVSDWENEEVKGQAKVGKNLFDEEAEKVAALRQRQEAYEASLPGDPLEALAAIAKTLGDLTDIYEPHFSARAALELVYELCCRDTLDGDMRDSLLWLACQGLDGIKTIEAETQRASDIARRFHANHVAFQA